MAETASEALEQIEVRRTDRKIITLDARQDFRYRAPKKIISFVLVNVLRTLLRQSPNGTPTEVAVVLAAEIDGNEVRITTSDDIGKPGVQSRCPLRSMGVWRRTRTTQVIEIRASNDDRPASEVATSLRCIGKPLTNLANSF